MSLAVYQGVAQDESGNALASPTIEVRRESDNGLATLFSDRAGTSALGNSFTGNADGTFRFYVVGIAAGYKITATQGLSTITLRNVAIGTAGELDAGTVFDPTAVLTLTNTSDISTSVTQQGALRLAGGLSVAKGIMAEGGGFGGIWSGSGTGNPSINVHAGNSGSGNGGFYQIDNGGALITAWGTASGIFSGTYDSTTIICSTTGLKLTTAASKNTPLVSAGVLSIGSTGTVGSHADGQLPATATNDNAAAGKLGEIIENTVLIGSAVSLTTATPANITSISLTAGDWDVWATISTAPDGSTVQSNIAASINTTSATQATSPNGGARLDIVTTFATGFGLSFPVGQKRISLSGTTTVYLVITVGFTTSTCGAYGYLGARRVR